MDGQAELAWMAGDGIAKNSHPPQYKPGSMQSNSLMCTLLNCHLEPARKIDQFLLSAVYYLGNKPRMDGEVTAVMVAMNHTKWPNFSTTLKQIWPHNS